MKKSVVGIFADGKKGSLLIEDGRISSVSRSEIAESCEILDFGENYLLPAFIEVHAHGGGGFDFIDNTEESFDKILDTHLSHGVSTLCPTLCACDFEAALDFLNLCKRKKEHPAFAGVHLEGPFLSPEMCGAQNLSCLRDPSEEDIERLVPYADVISRITVAPELPGAKRLTEKMLSLGIKMSAGHSATDAEGFYKARKLGIDSVTHLYSSMKGRYKNGSYVLGGLIEGALADDDCYVELIGDGHHVSRENFILTVKCKGTDRVVIVSDAMRAAGQYSPFSSKSADSYLGAVLPENRVIIEGGVAKLPDRTSFAGSIAVGDTMVKALVGGYGLPLESVSRMMSTAPARLLGLSDRGEFKAGLRADITVLDKSYRTAAVIRKGDVVYNKNQEVQDV